MAENLKEAGFNATLDVVDWATLIQRRGDPRFGMSYVTHSPSAGTDAVASATSDGAPAVETPAKDAALTAFNSETDPVKRGLVGQGPAGRCRRSAVHSRWKLRLTFGSLRKMKGYQPMPWRHLERRLA